MTLVGLSALLILALGIAFHPILAALRPMLDLPAQTLNYDGIAAMTWLREHTAEDALLLAADGEGWLPIFAERRAVDLRAVTYYEWDEVDAVVDIAEVDFFFQSSAGGQLPDLPMKLVFEQGDARVYEVIANN